MSDFDSLIEDAENFQEEDVDDYFVVDQKVTATKKRAADDDEDHDSHPKSSFGKKAKAPGCLADYFLDTAQPFPQNDQLSSIKSSTEQKNVYSPDNAFVNRNNSQHSDDGDKTVEVVGPLCFCGAGTISKTTLKEGQNKNRMFWICTQPRDSQCKFFEWRDETKVSSGTGNPLSQQSLVASQHGQKVPQSQITGPLCKCNLPSIMRTTMKEGPNHKRNFWVCPASREAQCKFFEWEDTASAKSQQSSYGNYNNASTQNSNNGNTGINYNNGNSNSNDGYGNKITQANNMGGGGVKGSCFKCGKEGHWSSNCPEAQGGGGGYNKGGGGKTGYGYNSNNSNNNSNSYGNRDSQSSGYGGKQSYSGGGENGQKTGSCYKCGESGHWSSSCPKVGGGYKR